MTSTGHQTRANSMSPPQSIPLQDLARQSDNAEGETDARGHNRGRSILSGNTRPSNGTGHGTRYERLAEASPSPTDRISHTTNAPRLLVDSYDDDESPHSPVGDASAFQSAVGFAGLSMPYPAGPSRPPARSFTTDDEFDFISPYSTHEADDHDSHFPSVESDQIPLTNSALLQASRNAEQHTPRHSVERSSFQSVRFGTPGTTEIRNRGSRLGDNLADVEAQYGRNRSHSYGNSLSPNGGRPRSRSPSVNESPLSKAGSIVRAMSQRVVNLSNEPESSEALFGRRPSIHEEFDEFPTIDEMEQETAFHPSKTITPIEKPRSSSLDEVDTPSLAATNPFRGKSMGIFSPDNPLRLRLCNILVHPWTEPLILLLIIAQTVLLAVESSSNVYLNPRPPTWGNTGIDWALFILFVIFTLEIMVRIIVSGFYFNAAEYSPADREKGIKAAVGRKYDQVFRPHSKPSADGPNETQPHAHETSSSVMAYLSPLTSSVASPTSVREMRRFQLARRAFLHHSLNRIDLIAIASFWICFALGTTGLESSQHLYVFRMMSCLRILRLLALTPGTAIILKSLKKAAPLLVNVSFLIGFFWLLFAIIGIQAFKSSFDRQCLWVDPSGVQNYNNNFTMCGGHLDNATNASIPLPWVYSDGTPGANFAKGYICPRGSLCMQQEALYNGTVSFDNIAQAAEMIFVIMSANTFTDLMYYTTNSDYLAAAIFFAAGIVIMMFWLTNLLIAVITSTFQVIREESQRHSAFTENRVSQHSNVVDVKGRHSAIQRVYDKTLPIWITIIAYGLLCQALTSATMDSSRASFIANSETVVTFLLLFEIVLRFVADWRNFFRRSNNMVDLALAIITTIILLPPIRNSGEPYAWLTVFQIIRVYRLVWAVPLTRGLIHKVLGNASGIGNLVLFVFLITFLVSILASQLFRGEIPEFDINGNRNRTTFFTIFNSFLGMYQILSSENWTTMLYSVTAYNDYLNTGWIGAVFLIGWFILAFFILVNMFIAVIQENFDVSEDAKRLQQLRSFLRGEPDTDSGNLALSAILRLGRPKKVKDPLDYGQAALEQLLKDAVMRDFLDEEIDPLQQNFEVPDAAAAPQEEGRGFHRGVLLRNWKKFQARVWHREPNPFYSHHQFSGINDTLDTRAMAREAVSAGAQRKRLQRDYLARHPNYNKSLFIFKPDNPVRKFCQRMVGPGRGPRRIEGVEPNTALWYSFSAFIYAAVLTMVILACVTTPLYQRSYLQDHHFAITNWFVWTDMAFAAVFTVEAIIKIIADGCFWTPNAYFRSLWGAIDGLVLITLWINVIASFINDGAVSRAVGAFKALRALRLLNVSDSARKTFHSVIFVGGWRVISAAFVSLSLLVPFAIYGLNLFNGKMMSCNDNTSGSYGIYSLTDCAGEWNSTPYSNNWPLLAPRLASNPYYDFDNFGDALFILFQIVSQEGWIDVMWSAQSIVGRGVQPAAFSSQGNAVFFVVFNLMATVFVLTLFVSVFMRTYTEQTGVAFLTADQRSWMELRKLLKQVNPSKRAYSKDSPSWKTWCYKRATEKRGWWHRSMTVILVLNLILLTIEFYPEPDIWDRVRTFIFLVCTVAYMVNIAVRIIGLSWPRFRRSSWDLYSLVAVGGTFITTILRVSNFYNPSYIRVQKLFLVSITLLLIPRNEALDQLFKTAAASFSSIGNLLATWFVLFLVFAIAMTQTFGLTRFGSQGTNNLNFRNVPKALIVLFRMSVGEGWNQIMEDYATALPPFCNEATSFFDSDCGSGTWAKVLFVAWNILSMYIFVSLFVSLIYESFSYVYQHSSGLATISRDELRNFKHAWSMFDPQGHGYITKEQFPRLLGELSGRFAMHIYDKADSVRSILEEVRTTGPENRASSIGTTSATAGIDLKRLNDRIALIDSKKVKAQRRRYATFYSEIMITADPDRGISFLSVLMILAHYSIISDSKSLKLDEFLRRKARLQKVDEEAQRRIVVGFFDTVYWFRKFRKHQDRHKEARLTNIPTFAVPEIVVDEDEGEASNTYDMHPSPMMTPSPNEDRHDSFRDSFTLEGGPFSNPRQRGLSDVDRGRQASLAPSATSSPARSPRLWPHRPSQSAHSFEVDLDDPGSMTHSRRSSNVSAENALEVFQESAWGESLRRSFTSKRPRGSSS